MKYVTTCCQRHGRYKERFLPVHRDRLHWLHHVVGDVLSGGGGGRGRAHDLRPLLLQQLLLQADGHADHLRAGRRRDPGHWQPLHRSCGRAAHGGGGGGGGRCGRVRRRGAAAAVVVVIVAGGGRADFATGRGQKRERRGGGFGLLEGRRRGVALGQAGAGMCVRPHASSSDVYGGIIKRTLLLRASNITYYVLLRKGLVPSFVCKIIYTMILKRGLNASVSIEHVVSNM